MKVELREVVERINGGEVDVYFETYLGKAKILNVIDILDERNWWMLVEVGGEKKRFYCAPKTLVEV